MWYRDNTQSQTYFYAPNSDQVEAVRQNGVTLAMANPGLFSDDKRTITLYSTLTAARQSRPFYPVVEVHIPLLELAATNRTANHDNTNQDSTNQGGARSIDFTKDIPAPWVGEIHPSLREDISHQKGVSEQPHPLSEEGKLLIAVSANLLNDVSSIREAMAQYLRISPKYDYSRPGLYGDDDDFKRRLEDRTKHYAKMQGMSNFVGAMQSQSGKESPELCHRKHIEAWSVSLEKSAQSVLNMRIGFNDGYVYEAHQCVSQAIEHLRTAHKMRQDDRESLAVALEAAHNAAASASQKLNDHLEMATGIYSGADTASQSTADGGPRHSFKRETWLK